MPNMIQLICATCGKPFERYRSEYNAMQRVKPGCKVFCSRRCSALASPRSQVRTEKGEVERICIVCGKVFIAKYRKSAENKSKWVTEGTYFCSRGCASRGSVTNYRRQRARETGLATLGSKPYQEVLKDARNCLLKREGYRYKDAEQYLIDHNIPYEFEYIIEDRIFDLYLPSINTIVEFDEPCHTGVESDAIDLLKDEIAKNHGMKIVRIRIQTKEIISTTLIESLFVDAVS